MAVTKKAKSIAEKLVPISPEFYDSQKDEDLIADKKVLFPFNAFLLFSQWVAFIVLMVWYASSANYVRDFTLQTDWDYGAGKYNCTPMMPENYWGTKYNFDTCQELARPPKISTPPNNATDSVIWVEAAQAWKYVPFAFLPEKPAIMHPETWFPTGGIYKGNGEGLTARKAFSEELKTKNTCKSDGRYATSDAQATLGSSGYGCGNEKTDDGSCIWYIKKDSTWTPSSNQQQSGSNQQQSGHGRKLLAACEVTQAEALDMFKLFYDKTYMCQAFKNNVPFACEAMLPIPISQVFSLAYANSLLLYTVFSAICVKIFFAAKKEPEGESAAKANGENKV